MNMVEPAFVRNAGGTAKRLEPCRSCYLNAKLLSVNGTDDTIFIRKLDMDIRQILTVCHKYRFFRTNAAFRFPAGF